MSNNKGELFYEKFKEYSPKKLNKKFILACGDGNFELVKFLMKPQELKVCVDIYAVFIAACSNNKLEIIKYFIVEENIEKTKYIQEFLRKNTNEEAENFFKIKHLSQKLEKELPSSKNEQKKIKL